MQVSILIFSSCILVVGIWAARLTFIGKITGQFGDVCYMGLRSVPVLAKPS